MAGGSLLARTRGGMNVNQLVDHAVSSCQGGGWEVGGMKWGGSVPLPLPTNLRTGAPVSRSCASELSPSSPCLYSCFLLLQHAAFLRFPYVSLAFSTALLYRPIHFTLTYINFSSLFKKTTTPETAHHLRTGRKMSFSTEASQLI